MGKRIILFLIVIASVVGFGRTWFMRAQGSSANADALYSVAVPAEAPIPAEALRLRIIANSDSSADQAMKLKVRNAVVVYVGRLLRGVTSSTQARRMVEAQVPELQTLAARIVEAGGFPYGVSTEVGLVPFPTKIYGNRVYPAGNYEALRIVLGDGQGQNWWCVLFPPLCFIDITTGDAVPNTGGFPDLPPLETVNVPTATGGEARVQVRLATVDYGEELVKTVKGWLHR